KGLKKRAPREPAAQPQAAAPPREYRASVRHPHGSGTVCTVEPSVHAGPAEERDCWPTVVEDSSRGGLALILGRRLEKGTVILVDLLAGDPRSIRSLPVRVVHVKRHGHGHWRIGCEFLTPLNDEEVTILL